ncbi:uncharacterized protein BX664DRAFT_314060 [Halteromyces radiatus]|uniref:uncharacterized protein n=1 Tax=Halteromyces radiatus TaxID=101107 RepID=UPI00222090F3|nr:uncharacterized protein BX664DRAFT_314060 [Halteromyces radiatus]KAI8088791.1 hypothetical protein BX664DRAFT_314060 [Halteromyces radiatus]
MMMIMKLTSFFLIVRSFSSFFAGSKNDTKGMITHDAIGGLIAFEVAKAYEAHCDHHGKPDDHAKAKEMLSSLIGAAATRVAETKGLDNVDEAKEYAEQQIFDQYDQYYV